MIEGISAVTLGTHEMPRAVRFYRGLGFEVLHGDEESSFTSFRAGGSYLNLIVQSYRHSRSMTNELERPIVGAPRSRAGVARRTTSSGWDDHPLWQVAVQVHVI